MGIWRRDMVRLQHLGQTAPPANAWITEVIFETHVFLSALIALIWSDLSATTRKFWSVSETQWNCGSGSNMLRCFRISPHWCKASIHKAIEKCMKLHEKQLMVLRCPEFWGQVLLSCLRFDKNCDPKPLAESQPWEEPPTEFHNSNDCDRLLWHPRSLKSPALASLAMPSRWSKMVKLQNTYVQCYNTSRSFLLASNSWSIQLSDFKWDFCWWCRASQVAKCTWRKQNRWLGISFVTAHLWRCGNVVTEHVRYPKEKCKSTEQNIHTVTEGSKRSCVPYSSTTETSIATYIKTTDHHNARTPERFGETKWNQERLHIIWCILYVNYIHIYVCVWNYPLVWCHIQ